MRERLATLAFAAGALALFYALFFPKPQRAGVDDLPLSTESGPHGYQALWRWLQSAHIPVESLRHSYDKLGLQPRGDLMIVTLPTRLPFDHGEIAALDRWVRRGNTLLVVAALDDTPDWSVGAGASFLHSLELMTELEFRPIGRAPGPGVPPAPPNQSIIENLRKALAPERIVLHARGRQPLTEGIGSMLAISENPTDHWRARASDGAAPLELADRPGRSEAERESAIWLKSAGDGQIMVVGYASLFSNALIGESDNARLFGNIVAWSRQPWGRVIFDDRHQGLIDDYDAKALFADPRLHRTLLWLIFVWLLFVLGWQRLRPARDVWNPLDVTAIIGATGDFFASTLTPATAAARLFENFFNAARRTFGLAEDGEPVWERLAGDARSTGPELSELARLHARAQAGGHVDLVRMQTLMSRVLRKLE